jgi:hypothetical protein
LAQSCGTIRGAMNGLQLIIADATSSIDKLLFLERYSLP